MESTHPEPWLQPPPDEHAFETAHWRNFMSRETILIVDDEPYILMALKRLLVDSDFQVLTASSVEEGLAFIQAHSINVVISDYCMPGHNGVEFLSQVKILSPATERILMTAHATVETAVQAINRGEIFRFIIKPWNNNELLGAVEDSLMRYRLLNTLRLGEEAMFHAVARMIELKDPYTRGHCQRVADSSVALAGYIGLNEAIRKEILWGGWLHDCGKVGVPEHILNFPGDLSDEDRKYIYKHPEWGASVVSQAGLSRQVVNIVLYHHERFSGNGYPFGLKGEGIPLEARIVTLVDVFDALGTDRPYRRGFRRDKVIAIIREMTPQTLDPDLVELFLANLDRIDAAERVYPVGRNWNPSPVMMS